MKLFFNSLLFGIILFPITNSAQTNHQYSGLYSYKNNRYSAQNLKDSVKSVHIKFSEPKQSLSVVQKDNVIMFNGIRRSVYSYYDELQRIKSEAKSVIPKQEYLFYDYEKSEDYEYNDKDWLEKSKYKTILKQYYPVLNHNLLVKLNKIRAPKREDVFGEEGKVWQNYNEEVYIYK